MADDRWDRRLSRHALRAPAGRRARASAPALPAPFERAPPRRRPENDERHRGRGRRAVRACMSCTTAWPPRWLVRPPMGAASVQILRRQGFWRDRRSASPFPLLRRRAAQCLVSGSPSKQPAGRLGYGGCNKPGKRRGGLVGAALLAPVCGHRVCPAYTRSRSRPASGSKVDSLSHDPRELPGAP